MNLCRAGCLWLNAIWREVSDRHKCGLKDINEMMIDNGARIDIQQSYQPISNIYVPVSSSCCHHCKIYLISIKFGSRVLSTFDWVILSLTDSTSVGTQLASGGVMGHAGALDHTQFGWSSHTVRCICWCPDSVSRPRDAT
jgi:hypothetical protein